MKNFKDILILLLIIMIVGLVGYMYINGFSLINVDSKAAITSEIIEERIDGISELATISYNYKDVLQLKDHKEFNGVAIPFSEKSLIMTYKGEVKAGISLEDITVKTEKDKLVIEVEKAQILDHVVDESTIQVIDEKDGLFNELELKDYFDLITAQKDELENELLAEGFLKKADQRVVVVLKSLFTTTELEQVEIVVVESL